MVIASSSDSISDIGLETKTSRTWPGKTNDLLSVWDKLLIALTSVIKYNIMPRTNILKASNQL